MCSETTQEPARRDHAPRGPRWIRLQVCSAVALLLSLASVSNAFADVPDVIWTALKERDVIAETSTGEVRGKLIGVDAKSVVILKADGTPVAVPRATVKNVRVVVAETPLAAPPPPAGAAPNSAAGKAADATPPPESPPEATAKPPAEPALSPDRPHPELEALLNQRVVLWTKDRFRIIGTLVGSDNETVSVKTGDGTHRLARQQIDSVEKAAPASSDWQGSRPEGIPAAPPEASATPMGTADSNDTSELYASDRARLRGVWLSSDVAVFSLANMSRDNESTVLGSFGVVGAPFNFGAGYCGGSYLIAARFGFQLVFAKEADLQFAGTLAARFEYIIGSGSKRGFLAIEPGYATIPAGRDSLGSITTGLSGGAHLFVGRAFSIDPYGEIGLRYVSEMETTAYTARLGLMFSGWVW